MLHMMLQALTLPLLRLTLNLPNPNLLLETLALGDVGLTKLP
jgi:hypothetical protein